MRFTLARRVFITILLFDVVLIWLLEKNKDYIIKCVEFFFTQIEVDIPRCHQYHELLSSLAAHAKFKHMFCIYMYIQAKTH